MIQCHWCGDSTLEGFTCKLCKGEKHMAKKKNEDIVNEPKHYARWKIEPITYIMLNGFEFWRGNIIKYASRAGYKPYEGMDEVQSEITDLEKVIRYAQMRINQLEGKDKL